ncbi:hypothetical protein CPB85DRAFT_1357761 [Mucidula mucida]|nr:hypothetical protein CPB85DRAFT_1357761 [Mucidula mucida]
MSTTVTYPANQPVQVFQPGQTVILQVDAYTVDDVPILKNTPVTIHTSSSYKIDRRISSATGNPKPSEVEYHFTVSFIVDKEQLGQTASKFINDVQLRPKPTGNRIEKRLNNLKPNKDYAFLKTAVEYRVRDEKMGTYTHKETLNAGQEIKIMRGPLSQGGNRETGRDYYYAPVRGWKKVVVVHRGKPLVHSAFRTA